MVSLGCCTLLTPTTLSEQTNLMSELTIRAYNVRYGDAFLISIPDVENEQPITRHVLIDCGHITVDNKEINAVNFDPILADIQSVLNGAPLDLYVLSCPTLDHMEGLVTKTSKKLPLPFQASYAWFTASLAPNYYQQLSDRNKASLQKFKKRRQAMKDAHDEVKKVIQNQKTAGMTVSKKVDAMKRNNDSGRIHNAIASLKKIAPDENTFYLHRESQDIGVKHPFKEASFEIWGPEFELDAYSHPISSARQFSSGQRTSSGLVTSGKPIPPAGVDASAFYSLVNSRNRSAMANLMSIDETNANSSLVFCINWKGWRLLFSGDALQDSWQLMSHHQQLKPVHFLKISNHLGYRGTPQQALFKSIFPSKKPDLRHRLAVASTYPDVIHGVPSSTIISRFEAQEIPLHIVAEELDDYPTNEKTPHHKPGYLSFKFGERRFLGMEKVFLGSNDK